MLIRAFILSLLIAVCSAAYPKDRTQAELQFVPTTSAEEKAGVWVDGHYVGFVKELKRSKKVQLLPGEHEVVVRQAWYKDYVEQIYLEPGTVHTIRLSMLKLSVDPTAGPSPAELKIIVIPDRAAVFVDGQFAGHVDEFDHAGQGMLISPGQHKLTVALPGYLPFETALNLHPRQKIRISTTLTKGSGSTAGSFVAPQ